MSILLTAAAIVLQQPARSHEVERCVPRLAGWAAGPSEREHHRVINVVGFWQGELTWNDAPADEGTLGRYLLLSQEMNPEPMLVFDPDGAPDCVRARQIRDLIHSRSGCEKTHLCAQWSRERWDLGVAAPSSPPPPPPAPARPPRH